MSLIRREFIISVLEALSPLEEAPVRVPGPSGYGNHRLEKLPPKLESK